MAGVFPLFLVYEPNVRVQVGPSRKHFRALSALEGLFIGPHVSDHVLLQLEGGSKLLVAFLALVLLLRLREVRHLDVCAEVVGGVEGLGAGRALEGARVEVVLDVLVQFMSPQVFDVAAHDKALARVLLRVVIAQLCERLKRAGRAECAVEREKVKDRLVHVFEFSGEFLCLFLVLNRKTIFGIVGACLQVLPVRLVQVKICLQSVVRKCRVL